MTSRLCLPSTAFAALVNDEICGLDHTFTFLKFPLVSGACQLVSTPFRFVLDSRFRGNDICGLGSGLPLTGFPEFDRLSAGWFPNRTPNIEPGELPGCSTPRYHLNGPLT